MGLIIKNLQLSIEEYFKNGCLNYNNLITLMEGIYRQATINHEPAFVRRIEDIVGQLFKAMQAQDEILFIDVIEYDLIPVLNWRP